MHSHLVTCLVQVSRTPQALVGGVPRGLRCLDLALRHELDWLLELLDGLREVDYVLGRVLPRLDVLHRGDVGYGGGRRNAVDGEVFDPRDHAAVHPDGIPAVLAQNPLWKPPSRAGTTMVSTSDGSIVGPPPAVPVPVPWMKKYAL